MLQSARRVPAGPLREIAGVLTDVLRRFRLVDGVLPIELRAEGPASEQTLCYRLGQGRSLRSLSAGQQAQFGLAQMVALNLAFSRRLGHRVLLFDDVITAFDLAQLVPTCVLLRQLAYGGPETGETQTGDAQDRRQIILSSHREDLTNRLIDLLLPPRNRSLKVVTLTRFEAGRGPGCEIYEATAGADTAEVRARLGGLLELALES